MPASGLERLIALTDPGVRVGIGLAAGDPRAAEVVERASFCPLLVYGEAAGLLDARAGGEVDYIVRGSLPSTGFLRRLKGDGPARTRRIALLTLPEGRPFLLGPVGIDEGGDAGEGARLISDMRSFCGLLGWTPRIAVMSAGRPEDAGRGGRIRRSVERAESMAGEGVRPCHITVEEAFPWANCLLAPDGVTGNVIYRTLVHLGAGSSLGALYFPLSLKAADTSRNGTVDEYLGAVALANLAASR